MTGFSVAATAERTTLKGQIDLVSLSKMVKQHRNRLGLKQEEVGAALGYAASTVSRIEQAKIVKPDPRLLTAICTWLGVPFSRFISGPNDSPKNEIDSPFLSREPSSIPDTIEVYLRASRDLEPDQVDTLTKVFREVYEAVTRNRDR